MKKSIGAEPIIVPTPAWIICSYDGSGNPNGMAVAWGGVCCSKPPCVTVSLRKATYSFGSIMARKAYTVNVLSEEHLARIDYFGIASGREHDKFSETGLNPVKSELVDAPFIDEAALVLECKLAHSIELGLHTMFVGEIVDAKCEESALDDRKKPDICKIQPVIYTPKSRAYYGIGHYLGDAYSVGKSFKK
jgi:flavin reductase (DIM6/NTAB) family NADH-FMN oxidoreductase RutF